MLSGTVVEEARRGRSKKNIEVEDRIFIALSDTLLVCRDSVATSVFRNVVMHHPGFFRCARLKVGRVVVYITRAVEPQSRYWTLRVNPLRARGGSADAFVLWFDCSIVVRNVYVGTCGLISTECEPWGVAGSKYVCWLLKKRLSLSQLAP